MMYEQFTGRIISGTGFLEMKWNSTISDFVLVSLTFDHLQDKNCSDTEMQFSPNIVFFIVHKRKDDYILMFK